MELKKKKVAINLPNEILEEIFLRLPRKYLVRFKCLSKFFLALLGSRNFQNMYHELISFKTNFRVVLCEANNKTYWMDYKSVSSLLPLSLSTSSSATMCLFHESISPKKDQDCNNFFERLSSWGDLSWMSTTKGGYQEFYILNTVTNMYTKIPRAPEANNKKLGGYSLCSVDLTNDYKFVRVMENWDSKCSDVDVYTLGSNSWKRIPSIPYYISSKEYFFEGVPFESGVHWLANTYEEGGNVFTKLFSFDIVNETFKEVALPEARMLYPEQPLEVDTFNTSLTESGGYLCLVFHVFSVQVDVWIMQEYGVKESWVKMFSSTLENLTTSKRSMLIWYFRNNETLWTVNDDEDLILYDPNKKVSRKLILDSDNAERVTVAGNYTVLLK